MKKVKYIIAVCIIAFIPLVIIPISMHMIPIYKIWVNNTFAKYAQLIYLITMIVIPIILIIFYVIGIKITSFFINKDK